MSAVDEAMRAAIEAHQAGRLAEAGSACERVLAQQPRHPDALHLLGLLAHQAGRHGQALALIGEVLQLAPGHATAHANLGNVLLALGRVSEAIASCRRALALQADLAPAHNGLGNALRAAGKLDEAQRCFRRALELQPGFPEAHNNLGLVLHATGRTEEALACLERALALRPAFPEALNNLGLTLEALGRPREALAHLEEAVRVRPAYAEAHNNLATAYKALGLYDAALAEYRRALELQPDFPEAHNNLGLTLEALGRSAEAIECFQRAQALRPAFAAACLNEGLALLRQGDFAGGWPLYEWRFEALGARRLVREFAQPLWLGEEPIAGRSILLHYEQGLGDTIQMLRFAPLLAAQGAQVSVEVPPTLASVARTLRGGVRVLAEGAPLPETDLQCPLMSLPLACGTTLASIPQQVPYLHAPAPELHAWAERLGARRRPRVGLAWSGSAGYTSTMRERDLPLPLLLSVLGSDAEFHSLQRDYRAGDRERVCADGRIAEWSGQFTDLGATAGLLAQLDLVVSIDTAVAHLAGAMGKPVWLLLPAHADHRWLLERNDSPWYPTMRLLRQPAFGDWGSVLARVAAALASAPWTA